MYVERYGTGVRTYLGLHGWGSDRRMFAPLAACVPPDASFYSADLPGCGASPGPHTWSVAAIVAEIVATVRALETQPVTLVGHCGGAVFGLLAAQAAGPRIARVVALDPFAYLPRYFRVFTGAHFGRRAYDATFANRFGRWLTNRTLNAGRTDQTDMTASFSTADHEVAHQYLHLFAALNVEQVRGLETEVDLVYGAQTFGAVKKSVALLQAVLPHAHTQQLARARHMPVAEATAQLARIIFTPAQAAVQAAAGPAEHAAEQLSERAGDHADEHAGAHVAAEESRVQV